MFNSRLILSDRLSQMWRRSREIAGLSQDHMAKSLGVSRKTVQNWENGTSSPSQVMGFEWFNVCELQPLPFYLEALYPEFFSELSSSTSDQQVDEALKVVISTLPINYKRKLLYLFAGKHGSSPTCILEMVTAHLQVPLANRLTIAETIYSNYDLAAATGSILNEKNIQPNTTFLKRAIDHARTALKQGKDDYTGIGGDL
ncbi:MAG: helix-turn-helix transcriptional regulator [Lachnospiraceae bacterium]|nr:helix-turn-helix transcriptional regulator [Lachnospiraceae bacterium]